MRIDDSISFGLQMQMSIRLRAIPISRDFHKFRIDKVISVYDSLEWLRAKATPGDFKPKPGHVAGECLDQQYLDFSSINLHAA